MTSEVPGNRPPQTIPQMLAKSAQKHQEKLAMKIKNNEGKWEVRRVFFPKD